MTVSPPPCIHVPCVCGRCYLPGTVVGDWVLRGVAAVRRALLRLVGRPVTIGRRGEALLPDWVGLAFAGGPLADEGGATRAR